MDTDGVSFCVCGPAPCFLTRQELVCVTLEAED